MSLRGFSPSTLMNFRRSTVRARTRHGSEEHSFQAHRDCEQMGAVGSSLQELGNYYCCMERREAARGPRDRPLQQAIRHDICQRQTGVNDSEKPPKPHEHTESRPMLGVGTLSPSFEGDFVCLRGGSTEKDVVCAPAAEAQN